MPSEDQLSNPQPHGPPQGSLRAIVFGMENARTGDIQPHEVYVTGMAEMLKEIVLYRRMASCSHYAWRRSRGEETPLLLAYAR